MGFHRSALNSLGVLDADTATPSKGKEIIPILFAMGEIELAHLAYRSRSTSINLASTFNQADPRYRNLLEEKGARTFIVTEGGPGDELRHVAMYRTLAEHFSDLHITCDPRLHSILERSFPQITFVPVVRTRSEFRQLRDDRSSNAVSPLFVNFLDGNAAELARDFELVCSSLDLLGDFRKERPDFQDVTSLLVPDTNAKMNWSKSLDPNRLNVGIAWRGFLEGWDRSFQYLRAAQLSALADIEGCHFWSLQAGADRRELEAFQQAIPASGVAGGIDWENDFEAQAAFIANLDLVISPMTTIGELSSVLGVETAFFVSSHLSTWRKTPDGKDIWHMDTSSIIAADPPSDQAQMLRMLRSSIQERAAAKRQGVHPQKS